MGKEQEKKCFIVTPIGSETDPIRRHIEGIIDAAIRPALGNKYELIVAHKIYEPGSITKQVISEIYNAELVIANLTDRNPNVMYELAFRHSLGKPVIMIAEWGTSLPSDIVMERVIFYHNDARGVLELGKALEKAESEIDFSKIGSPIYDVLHSIGCDINIFQISQNNTQTEQDVLPHTVGSKTENDNVEKRLEGMEKLLSTFIDEIRRRDYGNSAHIKSQEGVRHNRILWVDDYPINNEVVIDFLKTKNIHVDTATSTQEGIDCFGENKYDVIITDMGRGVEKDAGIRLIKKLNALNCRTPIIVFTSNSAINRYGKYALDLGAYKVTHGTVNIISILSELLEL